MAKKPKPIKVCHFTYHGAIIDIWEMPNGDIVLGGLGWYEYNDYLEMQKRNQKKEKKRKDYDDAIIPP